MADESEDFVPRVLQNIQATLAEQTRVLADHTQRFDRIERHLMDLSKLLRYSMGRNEETAFRQSQQESRIDELFRQLEKLLSDKEPT
jgi:hypothetical protein